MEKSSFNVLKSSIFSMLAAMVLLLIITISIFTNLSLYSIDFKTRDYAIANITQKPIRFDSSPKLLLAVREEIKDSYASDPDPILAPIGVTPYERITWFRKHLAEFKIIQSDELSRKFSFRAREFFDGRCDIRFFMTWISLSKAFRHREFLALESIFKVHPFGCVMILSRSMDSGHGRQVLKPLTDMGYRIAAVSPDLLSLFEDTPAETWFRNLKKGNVDPGEIPLAQNLSNLLRLAVLYKYGGVYLDTDVIVLKKLSDLRNTIGAQSVDEDGNWSRLNNAVLIFDKEHPLILKFIKEFSCSFDGNRWGHNGPYMVSRVVEGLVNKPHYNFTVLPPMAFYPVGWIKIGRFFQSPENPAMEKWVAAKLRQLSGETYVVHLWNRQSKSMKIEQGSILERLVSNHSLFFQDAYSVQ
ncbi:hypothetical protein AAC387_Pa04g2087 [Persea americana]